MYVVVLFDEGLVPRLCLDLIRNTAMIHFCCDKDEHFMRIIDRIALGTLPLIFVSISNIQNGNAQCVKAPCQGENKLPGGNALGYKFITTSRVYPGHNVEVYETCVENQSDRDMEFNWFIPGPSTFVPVGYSCSSPRSKLTHKDAPSYAGCLYYGNDWARDHATFIPHVDDQSKIDAEQNDPLCKKVT